MHLTAVDWAVVVGLMAMFVATAVVAAEQARRERRVVNVRDLFG
jgi:hypothetical protein